MNTQPFEVVAAAEEAFRARQSDRAEALYRDAIEAYTRQEPGGLDFALGRYGAFLLDQGRIPEAEAVLHRAIDLSTDIPAIWSDYVRILADRRDLPRFKNAIDRMAASVRHSVESEFLLAHARRTAREGAEVFAEAIARWTIERAATDGDRGGRWAAVGDLGRILERGGRIGEAIVLWRDAFAEGSTDSETVERLAMHLERAKDYSGAVTLIQEALSRGLSASAEETLRTRLARCEGKVSGTKRPSRPEVAAYSIRRASTLFEPLFQLRLKPTVRDLEMVGSLARCLLVDKDASILVDVNVETGDVVRRVEDLPVLGDTVFAASGCGIGVKRTAAVGKGPTQLAFLGADGRLTNQSSVPDATSQIACGPDLWYVGCRDGHLYAFDQEGRHRWKWETPGLRQHDGDAYSRPCPYYVAARGGFAAVSSMGNIYAVSPEGRTLWHYSLPNERQTRWTFTVPLPGSANADSYGILGLGSGASREEIKSAYRRSALATHPDRNPHDPNASARFREVQGAYEQLVAGHALEAPSGGHTFSVEIQGFGPTASFITANSAGVAVGSSQGRLYLLSHQGVLQEARALGDGPVWAALRPDGSLGTAWCDNALLFFRQGRIVNGVETTERPAGLAAVDEGVALWRRNCVQVMDIDGRLEWAVEFSRPVAAVGWQHGRLVCAAAVLAAFGRRG